MLVNFRTRIRPATILKHLHNPPTPKFTETLKMAAEVKSQRPICPFCSKPTRICLCSRLQNPALENSVSVTILQHCLERNHPLNSTRIAKLGLKNVTVATVSDVNFEARFDIRLIERVHEAGLGGIGLGRRGFDKDLNFVVGNKKVGFERQNAGGFEYERLKKCVVEEENGSFVGGYKEENPLKDLNFGGNLDSSKCDREFLVSQLEDESSGEGCDGGNGVRLGSRFNEPVVSVSICKYGGVIDDCEKPSFDKVLGSEVTLDVLSKGFVVKRTQKRQLRWREELEEYEEFELEVPPGSVLLFPSEDAVGVDGFEAMDFEVRNLIVLDGTWSKAKRIYKENPWLKLLPHLKLDLDKMSLYSEVRQQPKAGYLSTIESIVYALKALGDNSEGLDNLLDVFESMVGDQRRCKDERLSKMPPA